MALGEVLVGAAASAAATKTIELPSNLMGILRESYDSRQKVLDWMLSLAVVAICVWAFWGPLSALRTDKRITPSQDVDDALPNVFKQPVPSNIYTYNLPSSRKIKQGIGPSATRRPLNPSHPPSFTSLEEDNE